MQWPRTLPCGSHLRHPCAPGPRASAWKSLEGPLLVTPKHARSPGGPAKDTTGSGLPPGSGLGLCCVHVQAPGQGGAGEGGNQTPAPLGQTHSTRCRVRVEAVACCPRKVGLPTPMSVQGLSAPGGVPVYSPGLLPGKRARAKGQPRTRPRPPPSVLPRLWKPHPGDSLTSAGSAACGTFQTPAALLPRGPCEPCVMMEGSVLWPLPCRALTHCPSVMRRCGAPSSGMDSRCGQ